jgi:beta-glucanase (GH16 family)
MGGTPDYGQSFQETASYTSGRVLTKQKVHFSDGYIEFRVKLPQADRAGPPESGIWPAVWMLGEDINQGPPPGSVSWPACGEVDMMEWATGGGVSHMGWNAIWAGAGGTNACSAWPQAGNAACGPCPSVNGQCVGEVTNGAQYEMTGWTNFDHHVWHTYGLQWVNTGNNATDQMIYFIDGVTMGVFNLGAAQSAFKADMFLTINLALGGTLGAPIQITDWADTYMDVDYVRWYRTGQTDVCGLDADSDGGADAGVDVSSDASVDAGADVGVDASADASSDASVDASVDAGADAGAGGSGDGGVPSLCTGLPDGTSCSDGNLCNGQETCETGACVAGIPVTCEPLDSCHVAGTCSPSTGLCSNPSAPNGTSCPTGNACDGEGTCQSGVCAVSCPPQAPSDLTASAASSSSVNLTWAPSSTSGVTYDVFRSTVATFTPGPSSAIAIGQTTPAYSDTGLSASTTYHYFVEALDSSGTSSVSNEANASTLAAAVQINAGGAAAAPYVADKDFSGGTTIDHANAIDVSGVSNPAPAAVYQSARIDNFTYTVPGFAAGSAHTVRLHFAETYFSTSGSRTLNVAINGTQVLSKFDVYKTAGAKNKAVVEAFTANANTNGSYVIQFTSVVNNSLVSGIEID